MAKSKKFSFACKDIGMSCGFSTTEADRNALMGKISDHARSAHGMQQIDADTMKKVERAIKSA